MEVSLAGALICGVLLLTCRWYGGLTVALLASLAFGSTSLFSITSLGGSSPLIFTLFEIAFIAHVLLQRQFLQQLGTAFAQPLCWLVLLLIVYVVLGAVVFPRLFAGQVPAFVPLRAEGRVAEVPLSPVSGNATQSLYFVLGALTFFAFCIVLQNRNNFYLIRRGIFLFALLHVGMGFIDLFGKLTGAGDLLIATRTASYNMLTSVQEAGFWRITGAYPEASSFGAVTVSLLAFTFSYWRSTKARLAFVLSACLLILLVLSTSSTAYVGCALIFLPLWLSIMVSALRGRLARPDLFLILLGVTGVLFALAVYIVNEDAFDPIWDLLNAVVINKHASQSAIERSYWNYVSLTSVYHTAGLGLGIGSSRASSWLVAIASQLGILGTVIIGILVYEIVVCTRGLSAVNSEVLAIAKAIRAYALAGIVCASISGGDADPGTRFFLAAAIAVTCRSLRGTTGMAKGYYHPPPSCAYSST